MKYYFKPSLKGGFIFLFDFSLVALGLLPGEILVFSLNLPQSLPTPQLYPFMGRLM